MKLSDFELIPGLIIDVDDPECLGRVKCSAIGLFDERTMDLDVIPWCMPFSMDRYQTFSKHEIGRKVWILDNKENENEFWYIPLFDYIDITERLIKEKYDNDIEVLISRKTTADTAQLYYDDQNGFTIHYDEWKFSLNPEGNILLHGKDADLDLRNGHVYIGRNSSGEFDSPTKCSQLQILFQQLAKHFQGLFTKAMGDATPLKTDFQKIQMEFQKAANSTDVLCAKNISVN
jgi:hypothetical protein